MIQLAETHGFAWLISILAIFYVFKRFRENDNKVIDNNTKVIAEFQQFLQDIKNENTLILREQQDQNTVVRQIFDKLQDHDDRSEKIFTQTKLNEQRNEQDFAKIDAKLDAIIRESFDRRTVEKMQQEIKEEIKEQKKE